MFYVVGSVHGTGSIIVWNLSLCSLTWDTYCKDLWADSYVNFRYLDNGIKKYNVRPIFFFPPRMFNSEH